MEKFPSRAEQAPDESRPESEYRPEKYYPLITAAESNFIEDQGGEFRGFVEGKNERQEFKDVRIKRTAYYDRKQRAVVELYAAVDGLEDGGSELQSPHDVEGFALMMMHRRPEQNLGDNEPETITLQRRNFLEKRMSVDDLRSLAYQFQDSAIDNASRLQPSELYEYLREQLKELGWSTADAV